MSVNITFYHFTKKPNSTAQVTNSAVHKMFSCMLREGCSLTNPVVLLEAQLSSSSNSFQDASGNTTDVFSYNYAYIHTQGARRYFFVNNITYSDNIWVIYMNEDVLATYKDDITGSTQYVARSTSRYNSMLADNIYPTEVYERSGHYFFIKGTNPDSNLREYNPNTLTTATQTIGNAFTPSASMTSGCYVVGIVSDSSTGLRYYLLNRTAFCNFLSNCFTVAPSNTGLNTNVAHILFDFAQYIKFCKWYPIMPAGSNLGSSATSVVLGGVSVPFTGDLSNPLAYTIDAKSTVIYDFTLGIPVNKFVTEGVNDYLKLYPYSQYNLYFPPLGNIPLDSTKLVGYTNATLRMHVDLTTGSCQVQVIHKNNTNGEADWGIIYTATTTWGLTFPIYDLVIQDKLVGLGLAAYQGITTKSFTNITSGISPTSTLKQQLTTFAKNLISNAYPFNQLPQLWQGDKATAGAHIVDKATDIVTSVFDDVEPGGLIDTALNSNPVDAIASAFGQIQSVGNPESFLAYKMGDPFIYAYFYKQTDRDINRFGAPLEESVSLSSLTGFCKCRNANLDTFSSSDHKPIISEQIALINYLNTGFYIE